jgi:hypothetical protein
MLANSQSTYKSDLGSQALRASGASEEHAAMAIGVTVDELKHILDGKIRLSAQDLVTLAHLTRRRVSWFFTGE